jgi:hypothetical protein
MYYIKKHLSLHINITYIRESRGMEYNYKTKCISSSIYCMKLPFFSSSNIEIMEAMWIKQLQQTIIDQSTSRGGCSESLLGACMFSIESRRMEYNNTIKCITSHYCNRSYIALKKNI